MRGDICALSSSDDVLAPWLCGEAAVWLSAPGYFVTGRYGTTIQDTANLTELAYSRLKVNNPLGWDVLDALKLLSGLL